MTFSLLQTDMIVHKIYTYLYNHIYIYIDICRMALEPVTLYAVTQRNNEFKINHYTLCNF